MPDPCQRLWLRSECAASFLHTTVAETDDHIDILRLAEDLHHLLGGLDGVGERNRTAVKNGLFAERAKADAAALDHEVPAYHPVPTSNVPLPVRLEGAIKPDEFTKNVTFAERANWNIQPS